MKEFLKKPVVIVIGIILTLGILALVGKKYWGWFAGSKDSSDFPSNPKDGDTFVKDGIKYTYSCVSGGGIIAVKCRFAWRTDKEIQLLLMMQREAATSFATGGKVSSERVGKWPFKELHCETHMIINGKKYQFSNVGDHKSFPENQSSTGYFATYIDSQTHLDSSAIHYSISKQDFDDFSTKACTPTPPGSMADCAPDRVSYATQRITNSKAILSKGGLSGETRKNIEKGISQIQKWLDDCNNPNLPHNKWGFYLTTEDPAKHTAILHGTGPAPTQFKVGQKINVQIYPNIYWQAPSKSYSATIIGFDPQLGILTDIPYVGLTNLPPNVIPTMGDGYISY